MSKFAPFAKLVNTQLSVIMTEANLFVASDSDKAWEHYLASFPEGTNPVYKTRAEHDCSCCKHFIRRLGNVVSIKNGEIRTVWKLAAKKAEYPFNVVAAAMDKWVQEQNIVSLFKTVPKETQFGAEETKQTVDGGVIRWNHFYGTVSAQHVASEPGTIRGAYDANVNVFLRGLAEFSNAMLSEVIDLIKDKQIYRGEEHLPVIQAFAALKTQYDKIGPHKERELFIWEHAFEPGARMRNSAIGTLFQDLVKGIDTDQAIKAFESKVAPANYKRPTALVTPKMIEAAVKTIRDMGLEEALQRRFAAPTDISVNNVLWVSNDAKAGLKDGLTDMLLASAKPRAVVKKPGKQQDQLISIDDFLANVVPKATGMKLFLQNDHLNRFVSLTAPVHTTAGQLFKWDNNFAWSYDGDMTDTIKERVKAAGGDINALLRISLSWFNRDDLDLYVTAPNGQMVYFGAWVFPWGTLDVDMNAFGNHSLTPVENVAINRLQDGNYLVKVNRYNKRDTTNLGYVVEIECKGEVFQLSADGSKYDNPTAVIVVKDGKIDDVMCAPHISNSAVPKAKWGVTTQDWVKINLLTYSPNYWDGNATGNRHVIFALDKCVNPDGARGIYNEFLRSNLEQHRKVFELLGAKTKCAPSDNQISGVGFSSTTEATVTIEVQTEERRFVYNVKF